ncbi:MAG: GNAT family N-acetyltransferase [Cyanobacteria bacterium P01_H01_bin.15]
MLRQKTHTPTTNCSNQNTLLALDTRIALHNRTANLEKPKKLVTRNHAEQYVAPWIMKDGRSVTIRPICPEDEPLIVQFHQTLSEESVYLRYFHLIKLSQRIAHERLMQICSIDYDREITLVADYKNPETGHHEILGACHLSKLDGSHTAEFAMLITDSAQGLGLGTEFLTRLVHIAKEERIERVVADVLQENGAMQHVCQKIGFKLNPDEDDLIYAEYKVFDYS